MFENEIIDIIFRIIFSFFGTLGFSGFFNVKKTDFLKCSYTGMAAWAIYLISEKFFALDSTLANFPAIIFVAFMGEVLARKNKKPATVYIIPGIICFVPGYGIYSAMFHSMYKNYDLALKSVMDTISVAWIIAASLVIVSSSFGIFNSIKKNKLEKVEK